MPSVENGLAGVLRELAARLGRGELDVDAIDDAGGVTLAARYLAGKEYFYVLGNSLYSLAEAVGEIMKVASLPYSVEYRRRLEDALERLRSIGSGALEDMASCVEGGDECCAMGAAAKIYALADELAGVARNLRAVMPLMGEEE